MTDTLSATPVDDTTPYEVYISGNEDFLIPIVFPDYDVQVVGEQSFEVFGYKISTPKIKAPYLGHAGVILINGETGLTRYYEYGRYPNPNSDIPGNVRKIDVSDVVIKNGLITESSLKRLLREVSGRAGDRSRISGVVLRGDFFSEADDWLRTIRAQNNSPDKIEYDVDSHNCMTFTIDLADHLGLDTSWRPPVVVPSAYIEQFQLSQIDLDYDYETDTLEVSE
ncbi:hypothetical protein [Salinivibrio proteolyticus]|uniref:Type VI secretion system effector TseH-like domain-containing protein n=1 Tax=Salinivibrio proteolyticus TaxID=334715 RepID=A0ABY7L9A8_9GAMM|nr:hypothetical protein [Salinivibrio proteolyticus]WBA13834.1 hypothetical protein N7E60_08825 [Salinivibrio proteolyticus]